MKIDLEQYEIWFLTGSQHLYGEEVLRHVEQHSLEISRSISEDQNIPIQIVHKGVIATAEAATNTLISANGSGRCIGIIAWMHTFSPAKMWINGLKRLHKPLLHLHTQYNPEIPWGTLDMTYMNLHQSAHGGREFGFITARLGCRRKVVVGHWLDHNLREQIKVWMRACGAWMDSQTMKIARFGDNMHEVAVTDGNKISAQIAMDYQVEGYGLGELVEVIAQQSSSAIDALVEEYEDLYQLSPDLRPGEAKHQSLRDAAAIELGLEHFLDKGNFKAFTTTFENLHGLRQLPGIAVQRLMAKGFGFGAEGDWKSAALGRQLKVMGLGLQGGASFMEDYTYHFGKAESLVLGAHMLEICPSISNGKRPTCEIHPLSIGGKSDPVRLVFNGAEGPAWNACMIDLGDRFRLIINEISCKEEIEPLPKLPVARILWNPHPNLHVAAAAWIYAGGGHHTVLTNQLSRAYFEDFSEITDTELVVIDQTTEIHQHRQLLRWNESYYKFR